IPLVSVSTTTNSITIVVGGVSRTFTVPAFGTDIFLSSGDYDELTGILTLTLTNGSTIAIPFGASGLQTCTGAALNPVTDLIVTCSAFAGLLCQTVLTWPNNGAATSTTELLG